MAIWNFKDKQKNNLSISKYIYSILLLSIVGLTFYFSGSLFAIEWQNITKNIKENFVTKASTVVSETIWQVAKTDTNWNVNFLLVWVWGKWHQWAYNTDSQIVVSFSPSHKTLTFLSIPRDLWIKIDKNYYSRINAALEYHLGKTKDINLALLNFTDKVSEIIWLDIPYYVMADFWWFKKAIDTLGWLPINVPEILDDPTYPDDNERADQWWGGVNHLIINSGFQIMDWATALKYARSRHSTSDFDRSARQQAVISAVIDRLISTNGIANIWNLYNQYKETVVTNLTNQEIFWLAKYINDIKQKDSFTMPSDCIQSIKNMLPWCILYSPDREWFGGAAVLLQEWAKANSISNYQSIQKFASIIFGLPFVKNTNIYIANWIDKKFAVKYGWSNGIWNTIGITMKKYWLNVIASVTSDNKFSQNYIVPLWTWNQTEAITAIQKFITGDVIGLDTLLSLSDTNTGQVDDNSWFVKFDQLKKEIDNMSWQNISWQNSDIYSIKNINQLYNLTGGVLVVIGNQYLLDK